MNCKVCNVDKEVGEFYIINKKHETTCKVCRLSHNRSRERTELGFIKRLYSNQKKSSTARNMELPSYTLDDLIQYMYSNGYKKYYDIWVSSNYNPDMAPSIDRKNSQISYTIDNLQLITWRENNTKGNKERRKPIKIIYKDEEIIKDSIKDTADFLNVTIATIHNCMNKSNGFLKKRNVHLVRI